jgi:protein-L-isoaspartate O-methyltransferase
MVAGLVATGRLTSPAWRAAFEQVARHAFVPSFYEQTPTSQRLIDATTPDEWLRAVYADELLVISPEAHSSSTVPSLMAVMLEALNPADGTECSKSGPGAATTLHCCASG